VIVLKFKHNNPRLSFRAPDFSVLPGIWCRQTLCIDTWQFPYAYIFEVAANQSHSFYCLCITVRGIFKLIFKEEKQTTVARYQSMFCGQNVNRCYFFLPCHYFLSVLIKVIFSFISIVRRLLPTSVFSHYGIRNFLAYILTYSTLIWAYILLYICL
jgi:hypothetical protein